MSFPTHSFRYEGRSQLHNSLEWPSMRIELRTLNADVLPRTRCTCTGIDVTVAGRAPVRMKEAGEVRRVVGVVPGMASILPVGFEDGDVEIVSPLEVIHIFLPPSVAGTSALVNYGIDPARIEVLRGEGVADPLFKEVALAFQQMLSRPPEPTDKLFVEGASSMLAAHLFSKYSNLAGQTMPRAPTLLHEKLKRVLDLIECRFAEGVGLDEMAGEACLSTFHFARLFQRATGLSPHRYVTERRIREAKNKLAERRLSLVEIALEAGFGSQNNFTRIFRKHTGMTPGEFRSQQRF